MLHAASKFTSDKSVLKQIYYSRIRCKLDQSAVVWSSSLTQKNINDLERVQKPAMRIIYGKSYESYSKTLKELGMVSLAERRDFLCLKFAKKSLKVENFGRLLPISSKGHKMKTRHWYSKRYMQSAIPSMQRILNRDKQKQVEALKQISVLSPTNFAC